MPRNPFRRPPPARRALVASAARLQIGDKKEALRARNLRQGWQAEAWAYYDAIGELRYAHTFMANAISRIRIYPAVHLDPNAPPVPVSELGAKDFPREIAAAAIDDLDRLSDSGYGPAGMLHTQTLNGQVAGEYFIVGLPATADEDESWSIRSIDEIVINNNGEYYLRDRPPGFNGYEVPPRPLGPDAYISRVWTAHPRYAAMATCAMRPILESCEELLLASRMIRATLRSRIAGAGILLVPDELELLGVNPTDDDPQANPFFEELSKALVTPLQSEGDASEVVPVTVRGPAEVLKELRHIVLDRPIDQHAMALRAELLKRIATGIDLPAEVVTGVTDLNHWSAWQVDDNTFRHHIEPTVLENCRGLAGGYARPQLLARDYDRDDVRRLVYWYDPTELVTHPDRSADAMKLHESLVLSDEKLLEACGFDPKADKPSADEFLVRLLSHSRSFPPNVVEALFHKYAPGLEIPADHSEVGFTDGVQTPSIPASAPAEPVKGPPADDTPPTPAPPTTASAAPARTLLGRESQRLATIDRQLRDRLTTAADASLRRQLEKAGARVRSKLAKNTSLRATLTAVPQTHVAATVGRDTLTAAGVDPDSLLDHDYTDLHGQYQTWVRQAQTHAAKTATVMGADDTGVDDEFDTARDAGWTLLAAGLATVAARLLFDPSPDAPAVGEYDASLLAPAQLIRAVVGVAGGYGTNGTGGVGADWRPVDPNERIGGVGTGTIIGTLLDTAGLSVDHWEWSHGGSARPFDPHVDLDGATYVTHDDEQLANTGDFPDTDFYFAGDHDGCTCDEVAVWSETTGSGDEEPAEDAVPVAASASVSPTGYTVEQVTTVVAAAVANIPPAQVHVHTAPDQVTKQIVRDAGGNITGITEENRWQDLQQ